MTDLLAARSQFAMSLAFHIIFACIGMVLPLMMAVAHYKFLKTKDNDFLRLTKAWMRGFAIFFVVGAVSGTIISFELGLLWPTFMEYAGPIIGMPFSLEGAAFFTEAVALGIYLYGWKRVKPWTHWWSGVVVGLSGMASGLFVVAANSWMNSPAGFDIVDGVVTNIDPIKALFNPGWGVMALHMMLAAIMSVGFAVAGVHALLYLKAVKSTQVKPDEQIGAGSSNVEPGAIHKKAIWIALVFAIPATFLQPLSGDISAKWVAKYQPAKLAAFEALFHTQEGAPLLIGGIPNEETQTVSYGIEVPKMLSFLAFSDFNAEVKGLDQFPKDEWPPILVSHIAFQIMVGIGFFLMAVAGLAAYVGLKARVSRKKGVDWLPEMPMFRLLCKILVFCIPLGFIALEAGWIVTEVGRQPWIIYGIMKTKDALTPVPGLIIPFMMFSMTYFVLTLLIIWLMKRNIKTL